MLEHVPDPASIVRACARLRQARRLGVLLDASTATPRPSCSRSSAPSTCCSLLPKGTHEYATFIRPSELARLVPRRRPELQRHARHGIQPADAALPAVGRHQRQLPVRLPQAGMTAAPGRGRRGAVRPRRHADRQRARPRRRRQRHARSRAAWRRCPTSALRPMVGSGARGMVGVGFGIAPDDAGYLELRDEFLRRYEARMPQRDARVRRHAAAARARSRARGIAWGIVTNKATRFAAPLVAGARASAEAAGALVCGDTTPHAKPHPAPLLEAARRLGRRRRRRASTSATTCATCRPAAPPACAPSSPPGATSARASRSRPGAPTPSSRTREL